MKIWFDTEFYEDGRTIELISIGMVREDGATYYAETPDAGFLTRKSSWLHANVAPYLKGGVTVSPKWKIAGDILEFAGDAPEFWAWYADYDWVVLCQLYGRMIDLPEAWPKFCRDLKQLTVDRGSPTLPRQAGAMHDALADATWCRDAWKYLAETTNLNTIKAVTDLSFSEALRALKQGKCVARAGWNGKGMWLAMIPGQGTTFVAGINYPTMSWIGMKTVHEQFVPWLASQTDMLAEDWMVVP